MESAVQRFTTRNGDRADAFCGFEVPRDGQATEHSRGHIVRVSFNLGGHIEDGRTVEVTGLGEGRGGGDAGHNGLGGRAHATSLRDVVGRFQREAESAEAERGTGTAEGGDHEVGFVAWEGVGTLAVDDHVGNAVVRVVVERESELVMVVERQTHGIEAGAEVGGRGGHAHVNAIADWIHGCSLKRSSLIRGSLGIQLSTHGQPFDRLIRGSLDGVSPARAGWTGRR